MFDVGIVGAGPSGSWTAAWLAKRGLRVALFDGSHPREKRCGGGLTARALAIVADGLAGSADALPRVTIDTVRFVTEGRHADISIPVGEGRSPASALAVFARRDLDGKLLDHAIATGATFLPTRVVRVERDGAQFRLTTATDAHRCRHLVGADGANSLVRRSLGRAFARSQLSIATGFYAHGVTTRDIVLDLVSDPPGYLWSFPRTDHLSIGVCAQADAGVSAESLRARTRRWIDATGLGSGARLEPYSWPIPSLNAHDLARADVGGQGWLLVGDAAGLVDPITREGILYALLSAEHAAHAIQTALTSPAGAPVAARAGDDDIGLTAYRRLLRAEILPELARAAELKASFFHPRFIQLTSDALTRSAALRRVMADLLAGTQPYRGLRRRLLGTLELGLAWRLFIDRWGQPGRWAAHSRSTHPRNTRHGHAPATATDCPD